MEETMGTGSHWTSEEDDAAVGNSRALNALFNVVDPNIFKLINTCKSAKVAWDTLEVAFEGTSKVKISRLQILTSHFEALQMTEEETIAEFNVRVLDITNESDVLEEKMSDSKLVWKVLRSLPSKFNMKVTTIEEANDLSKMKLDELFGSLCTFEIHLGDSASKRKPGLALTSVKEESTKEYRISQSNNSLAESMALLTKCHECEGFGHIQTKCATYLKCKKKSLVATLSDEEDYSESDDEEVGLALISITTMNKEEAAQVTSQASDQQESMIDDCLNDNIVQRKWKEDQAIIIQQQERIQCLMEKIKASCPQ
ncbi:gag-pol polyprotein [Cucumis melo var. makuwa]|uniref:Gag-pol polyprotein n=1 Tax=Cucumis melo var. makuwa TaxID=1194695 RepID=A0A5A7UNH8_CUCMM|nr:gag-pol polyprotein [Cucumis melo var. makuwa]